MSTVGRSRVSFVAVAVVVAAVLAGCSDGSRADNKVPELTFEGDLVRGSEVTMVLDGLGGLRGKPVTIEIFGEDSTVDARFTGAVVPEGGILRFGFYVPSRLAKDKVCIAEGRCERPVLAVGKPRSRFPTPPTRSWFSRTPPSTSLRPGPAAAIRSGCSTAATGWRRSISTAGSGFRRRRRRSTHRVAPPSAN